MREDVLSVPLGRAASGHSIPASALEHHTCWLSGTGRFMRDMAGTQTELLWAYTRRCTGFCKTSAKLSLVHSWQTSPNTPLRIHHETGSPFPSGMAVCACKPLTMQSPEAANLETLHRMEVM